MRSHLQCTLLSCSVLLLTLLLPASAHAQRRSLAASSTEPNTNRSGHDYKDFDLLRADPSLCADACMNDPRCRAWTYVKPNTRQGPNPRCWLKSDIPDAKADTCCISGAIVDDAVGATSNLESGTDRPGGDYTSFLATKNDPAVCRDACASDGKCKAWTYVNPGIQDPSRGKCWLKSTVPPAIKDVCCTSGVVQRSEGGLSGYQPNTDRPGSDLAPGFGLLRADPSLCADACLNSPRCRAWTYVKPGVQAKEARCWLKGTVPPAQPNQCCDSGVRRKF